MQTVLLVIHLMLAIALIGTVLLQKSEGGALGMGGGGMSGFMTGRSTANLLTRTTAILAGLFFLTSVLLVVLAAHRGEGTLPIDRAVPVQSNQTAPAPAPTPATPPVNPAAPPAPASGQPATPPAGGTAAPPAPATAPAPAEPSAPVSK
ncbi:MAG TPA: preprotein translocase subunit SecG [Stellaceae bacterium]|nr:preprotein translocase subunit SecG [Stellaceae bacterium]